MRFNIFWTSTVAANYLYQFFTDRDWGEAFKRAYFMVLGVCIYHLVYRGGL